MTKEILDSLKSETIDSEPELRELLELARVMMLRQAKGQESKPDINTNGENSWPLQKLIVNDDEEEGHAESVIPAPSELSELPINPEIQLEIEQLGEDILEEAFECFGDAGKELLEHYKDCGDNDLDEKIKVVKKLLGLVGFIAGKAESKFIVDSVEGEECEPIQYPPIRISPKLIGELPNPKLEPSCLGRSILITSFFHKAGTPTLHAGLVMAHHESELLAQIRSISQINEFTKTRDIDTSNNYIADLRAIHAKNADTITDHSGFHAATYVKITDDRWLQLDPNYGSVPIPKDVSPSTLDKALTKIQEDRKNGYIGSEKQIYLQSDPEREFTRAQLKLAPFIPSSKEVEDALINSPDIDMYQTILTTVFSQLLEIAGPELDKSNKLYDIQDRLKGFINLIADGEKTEKTVRKVIRDIVRDIFTSNSNISLDQAFSRTKVDEHFRRRRVADLQLAPLRVIIQLQSDFFNARYNKIGRAGSGHVWVDLGHPSYRVGMSVLSDIAVYGEDKLPLSTWLSYWGNTVSLFEHISQNSSSSQEHLKKVALKYGLEESGVLTNLSTVTILRGVLESSTEG